MGPVYHGPAADCKTGGIFTKPTERTAPQAPDLLDGLVTAAAQAPARGLFKISGDCMEGVGIVDGGTVVIDFTRRPAPPRYKGKGWDGSCDCCLCYALPWGQGVPVLTVRQYVGRWGPWHMVGTRYDLGTYPDRLNSSFPAAAVLGVVLISYDRDGATIWERDPASFPEALPTAPTISGENIGDPCRVSAGGGGAQ